MNKVWRIITLVLFAVSLISIGYVQHAFSKKSVSFEGLAQDKDIIDVDKLSASKVRSNLSKYQKLPDSQKVRIKGEIYTMGQLKQLRKKNMDQQKSEETKIQRDSMRKLKRYETQFNNSNQKKRSQKVRQAQRIINLILRNPNSLPKEIFIIRRRRAADLAESRPIVEALSVSSGQPRDPVVIMGKNFGTQTGKVEVTVAPNRTEEAPVELWREGAIKFYVPDVSGIPSNYRGNLVVQTADNKSSEPAPFEFEPELVLKRLTTWRPDLQSGVAEDLRGPGGGGDDRYEESHMFSCSHIVSRNAGGSVHSGGLWFGCSGRDIYFEGVRLKNGWVVDNVQIRFRWLSDEANVYIDSFQKGSPRMRVTTGYSVEAVGMAAMAVDIYIVGPKGIPYK